MVNQTFRLFYPVCSPHEQWPPPALPHHCKHPSILIINIHSIVYPFIHYKNYFCTISLYFNKYFNILIVRIYPCWGNEMPPLWHINHCCQKLSDRQGSKTLLHYCIWVLSMYTCVSCTAEFLNVHY